MFSPVAITSSTDCPFVITTPPFTTVILLIVFMPEHQNIPESPYFHHYTIIVQRHTITPEHRLPGSERHRRPTNTPHGSSNGPNTTSLARPDTTMRHPPVNCSPPSTQSAHQPSPPSGSFDAPCHDRLPRPPPFQQTPPHTASDHVRPDRWFNNYHQHTAIAPFRLFILITIMHQKTKRV